MCIVTVMNHGLRNGGGVGDILRKPSKDVSASAPPPGPGQQGSSVSPMFRGASPPTSRPHPAVCPLIPGGYGVAVLPSGPVSPDEPSSSQWVPSSSWWVL